MSDPTLAREAAELSGDDVQLLHWHELEIAIAALPPIIDGARRAQLVHVDPLATTWDAWDTQDGGRLLVRCIRARWKDDPVMLRRMAKGARGPRAPEWRAHGDWPHLRIPYTGTPVHERFPIEDPPSTRFLASVLGAGLEQLEAFHSAGIAHGGPLAHTLIEKPEGGFDLLYLDPFPGVGSMADDLSELARLVVALDPIGRDSVTRLAESWCESPPPRAEDGLRLLSKALASELLELRHRLALVRRHAERRSRVARLSRATTALWTALTPPVGTWCVRAGPGALVLIAESDGKKVRGGMAATLESRFLPVLFDSDRGLDAQQSRFLLRAWATRHVEGDESQRLAFQSQLDGDDQTLGQLLRWLANMARLRAARLLLREIAG